LEYYTTFFSNYKFEIKHYNFFQEEKYLFDLIFLTSDTDTLYFKYFDTEFIKNNTICITHSINYLYQVIPPDARKTIYVRPFTKNDPNFFLPCFSINNCNINNEIIVNDNNDNNVINIAILGRCTNYDKNGMHYYNYNTSIINRIESNKKIRLHVISRHVTCLQFFGISPRIELHTYENISTSTMFRVLNKCSFIITDVNCFYTSTHVIDRSCNLDKHITGQNIGDPAPKYYYFLYEKNVMSGAIPLAFSLCIPLIISKQTNEYYKFKNVIEFDKNTDDAIYLNQIDPTLLEEERNEMNVKFNSYIMKYIEEVNSIQIYKMQHQKNYKMFYINMDDRLDRRNRFEKHMKKYDLDCERFSGIKDSFGSVGCAKSHLTILKIAKHNGYENVIIMEDDFAFNLSPKELDEKLKLIFDNKLEFDAFHLSFRWRLCEDSQEHKYLKKLKFCHYCSCYIINNKCYDELIEWWEKTLPLLEATRKTQLYSCDVSYMPLLKNKKWYCFDKPVGVQLSGYSNIENRYIDHYKEDIIDQPYPIVDKTAILFDGDDWIKTFNYDYQSLHNLDFLTLTDTPDNHSS
jgi:glycosyl transferase family 25